MSKRVVADPSEHGWIEVNGKWVWDAASGATGAGMVISELEPSNKTEGMQWLNPTNGLVQFWDDEKWLQMPTTGAAGKDGQDGADGADGTNGSDGLWTDNGGGSISYDGTVRVGGKNGEGLHFDLFGGDDYVIQESTSNDIMSFGAGTAVDFTHNISSGTVTVNGDLLAAKAGADTNAFSAGVDAGKTNQGPYTVAVGNGAGESDQKEACVAVGVFAGRTSQGVNSVAIGGSAGNNTQGSWSVAIGQNAAMTEQGEKSVAIGRFAGQTTQGGWSVAVGNSAGYNAQGIDAVALGDTAGYSAQNMHAIAIGQEAGKDSQGQASIAIGRQAGKTSQAANGIIISSTGEAIDNTASHHIQIQSAPTKYLLYNGSNSWTFSGGPVNGLNGFRQNGAPVIDAKGLISTLSTLRNATKDETTLEGMRDALSDAIGGIIENFENEIATQEVTDE